MKHFVLKKLLLIASLAPLASLPAFAEEPDAFELLNPKLIIHFGLSPEIAGRDNKVLIENVVNGRSVLVDAVGSSQTITPKMRDTLSSQGKDAIRLRFTALQSAASAFASPRYFDSSIWKIHERLEFTHTHRYKLEAKVSSIAGDDLNLLLKPAILMDLYKQELSTKFAASEPRLAKAWNQMKARQYGYSLATFDDVLKKPMDLSEKQRERAHFGRGLSRFHQRGCGPMEEDFKTVEDSEEFRDDIRYYRALCAIEANDPKKARLLFTQVRDGGAERYADATRLYLGIVAELEEDFETAEGTYLDTIDFSQDQNLVSLAKDRLSQMKERRARAEYARKIFSVLGTLGGGYDTNAISLPASLTPADYSVQSSASPTWIGALMIEAKNPWLMSAVQKFSYNGFALGNTSAEIAPKSDVHAHEVGANISWTSNAGTGWTTAATYNLIYLGKIGASLPYLKTPSLKVDAMKALDANNPSPRVWQSSTKFSYVIPAQAPLSTATDATAYDFSHRSVVKIPKQGFSWGPGFDTEWKLSKGSENSFIAANALVNYQRELGWWNLNFSQDAGAGLSSYYQSAATRKDWAFKYSASISRLITAKLESRLQVSATKTISNNAAFQYDRYQASFLLTAFY